MSSPHWFSSKVRFACLIEGVGCTRYRDSVYLFQATDFNNAFLRILQIAKKKEEDYENDEGKTVQWRVKEILSLDQIGIFLKKDIEVYSEPVALENKTVIPYESQFHPEDSQPTQTI